MKKQAISLGALGLGSLAAPIGIGAATGALTGGDHPLTGAALGALGGGVGGALGTAGGAAIGGVHGGLKGTLSGGKKGFGYANRVVDANRNVHISPRNPDPYADIGATGILKEMVRLPVEGATYAAGTGLGAGIGGLHGAATGAGRGALYGGLGGSLLGGTLGGTVAHSLDKKEKTSMAKEPSMQFPFTEYMQSKTAGYTYYSPIMIPAGIGALTGAMSAGPDRRILGGILGGGAGLVGGHLGGMAGKTMGGVEGMALRRRLEESGKAIPVEGLSNISDYASQAGQLAGAGAGGYLGGSLAGLGNRRDEA